MLIGLLKIKLHAPYVHSLKEKRMIVKSIISKLKNKFNVSVCEIAEQDTHQTIIIGIAILAAHIGSCDSTMDHILDFIEDNCQAEVVDVIREIR